MAVMHSGLLSTFRKICNTCNKTVHGASVWSLGEDLQHMQQDCTGCIYLEPWGRSATHATRLYRAQLSGALGKICNTCNKTIQWSIRNLGEDLQHKTGNKTVQWSIWSLEENLQHKTINKTTLSTGCLGEYLQHMQQDYTVVHREPWGRSASQNRQQDCKPLFHQKCLFQSCSEDLLLCLHCIASVWPKQYTVSSATAYLYCTATILLLYCYCTSAMLLLHLPTVLLLYLYCTSTVLPLYLYCTFTVLPQYLHCISTVLPLYL